MTANALTLTEPAPGQNTKPPVLLVHGMWCQRETMHEVRDAFREQGYTVESLCLPGHHGKAEFTPDSKAELGKIALQDFVAYLIEQIRKQPRPPILVGHSMGALLAQLAAAQVPCDKLILLSSAAPAGIVGLGVSVLRTLGRNMLRFPLWKQATELTLKNVQYGIANAQSAPLQREIFNNCTYESGMAMFQLTMGAILGRRSAAWVDFERIRCPVLIIGGTEDRITPIRIQRSIAERFGHQAKRVEITGCCHWTIGGKYFPAIRHTIFDWLETNSNYSKLK